MPSWRTSTPTRPACGSCAVGPGSRPPSRLSPTTNQKRRDHTGLVLLQQSMSYSNRKRVVYILVTEDEELGKEVRRLLEEWRATWWKWILKYYDGKSEEPYYQTSETG